MAPNPRKDFFLPVAVDYLLPPSPGIPLSILRCASAKTAAGLERPLVASSSAVAIDVQNLPICGMFGMTSPASAHRFISPSSGLLR
ncbi:MAG TPA: hypothetical protein VHS80_07875, partial [Chthoniobacterales bacterium]|nr:hypothetical protein [Chthoniobacterales bacterium]